MPAAGISPEVASAVFDFITYAMIAAGAMAVYFGFRFLFYESSEDRSAREAARDELRGNVSRRIEEHGERARVQEGVSRRRHLLEPSKGFLIRAMQHCDEGRDEFEVQSDRALRRGRDHAQQVHHNLNSARRVMRTAWHHARGEQRNYLQQLTAAVETLRNRTHTDVIGHMPHNHNDPHWHATVTHIRDDFEQIRDEIAAIIQSIDQFIDEDQRNDVRVGAGGRGGAGGGASGSGGAPSGGPSGATGGPSGGPSGIPLRGGGVRGRVGSP
jgi:exonuclease VII small subunit